MFSDFKRAGTKMGRKSTSPRTNRNQWQRIVGIAAGNVTPRMVSGRLFGKQGRASLAASGHWGNVLWIRNRKELFQDNDLEKKIACGTQEIINTYWFNAWM